MRDGSATPQWLFDLLNEQVQDLTGQEFQLDAAAAEWNAKCEHYFDEEMDALKQDWSGRAPPSATHHFQQRSLRSSWKKQLQPPRKDQRSCYCYRRGPVTTGFKS